ncbi:MAG: hypothetical protein RIC87_03135 [Kiloniellales bacterium]
MTGLHNGTFSELIGEKSVIIVSYGVAKSSSSYAFQLIDSACYNNFDTVLQYKEYRRDILKTNSLDDMASDLNSLFSRVSKQPAKPIAFKTHEFFKVDQKPLPRAAKEFRPLFRSGDAICVGTYRDPRDVCLSFLDHGERDRRAGNTSNHMTKMFSISDTIAATKWQFRNLRFWSKMPNTILFSYEEMTQNTNKCLEIISDKTGLSYDIMKKTNDTISKDKNNIWQYNKGIANRYNNELSSEEIDNINKVFSKQIDLVKLIRSTSPL